MEMPPEIERLLKLAAPTLGLALGGPLGGAAATIAVAALSKYLSPKIVNSPMSARPDEIVAAIVNNLDDPELTSNLKKADEAARDYERDLGFKFADLEAKERTEIRQFQSSAGLATEVFKFGRGVVYAGYGSLVVMALSIVALMFGLVRLPTENTAIITVGFSIISSIITGFSAWAVMVLSFYYGRSADSDAKSNALQTALQTSGAQLGEAAATASKAAAAAAEKAPSPQVVVVPQPSKPATDGATMTNGPSRFIKLVEHLLAHEGGYVDNPNDPGRCTNLGITIGTLGDWRGTQVTCEDVYNLKRDEAKEIYFAKYWNAVKGDMLPPGIDYIVFDFAVNAGVRRSASLLQTVLAKRDPSLKVDGAIGPLTIGVFAKTTARSVLDEFHEAKMDYYKSLPIWPTFGNGWTNRAREVYARASAEMDLARVA